MTGQGDLSTSSISIRDLMRLHRVGAEKDEPLPLEGLICTHDRFKDGEVVGSTVLMFPPLVEMVVPLSSSSDASYLSGEDEEKEGWASDSGRCGTHVSHGSRMAMWAWRPLRGVG